MIGGVIPDSMFRCLKCGAEYDEKRGNKTTKVGQECGSLHFDGGHWTPCMGTLVRKVF